MAADINKGRVRGKRSGLRQDELSIGATEAATAAVDRFEFAQATGRTESGRDHGNRLDDDSKPADGGVAPRWNQSKTIAAQTFAVV